MKKSQRQLNLEAWKKIKQILRENRISGYFICWALEEIRIGRKARASVKEALEVERIRLHIDKNEMRFYGLWSKDGGMHQRLIFVNRQIKKLFPKVKP